MQANCSPPPQSTSRTSSGSAQAKASRSRLRVTIASRARSISRAPSRAFTARIASGGRSTSSARRGRSRERGPAWNVTPARS
ncbi:MAG: hypothetical protein A2V63_08740 [Candidatus Eisenbacteria bacterium RBG_19FT_COMBO_70_11]|nr:MAG: hypothetical protein A2V63_08740 [Candidatus Eisenbacteria bacterium RBG_19FT_COMBO_70_11]